jgi:hypothetical protein
MNKATWTEENCLSLRLVDDNAKNLRNQNEWGVNRHNLTSAVALG